MLEVNKYYQCRDCGRTYRCRVAHKFSSACGHRLESQREITKDEYRQTRMSCYRNHEKLEKQNKLAREAANMYGIRVTDKDDAISIFGKSIGLKKQQVIRLFSEIGWRLYHRRNEKARARSPSGFISGNEVDNTPPESDDVRFFYHLQLIVALARGIPHSLRMDMHPKFREYTHFFSLAIHQFAYCYSYVNNCSQHGLCWLFDGLHEVLIGEAYKESALQEAEDILKKQRGGG